MYGSTLPTGANPTTRASFSPITEDDKWWHPENRSIVRTLALVACCLIGIGSYVGFDSIGIVQLDVEERLDLTPLTFSYLYSAFHVPTSLLPFVGARFVAKLSLRWAAVAVTLTVLAGLSLCAVGLRYSSFALLLTGRVLFGAGTELCYAVQDFIAGAWFQQSLPVALTVQNAASSFGTWLSFFATPQLIRAFDDWHTAAYFAFFCACISLTAGILYSSLDYVYERVVGTPVYEALSNPTDVSVLCRYSAEFWVVCALCLFYYVIVFPFQSVGTALLQHRYGLSQLDAAQTIAIIPFVVIFAAPIMGWVVSKVGRKILFALFGLSGLTLSAVLLYYRKLDPVYAVLLLAFSYSCIPAALYPCISQCVPAPSIGSAYGTVYGVCNLAMIGVYLVLGRFAEIDRNGDGQLLFFAWLGGTATALCGVLLALDLCGGGLLNAAGDAGGFRDASSGECWDCLPRAVRRLCGR